MPKFLVTIQVVETKRKQIEVTAEDWEHAEDMASMNSDVGEWEYSYDEHIDSEEIGE